MKKWLITKKNFSANTCLEQFEMKIENVTEMRCDTEFLRERRDMGILKMRWGFKKHDWLR